MNPWKISTIILSVGVVVLVGRGAVAPASAAGVPGGDGPHPIGWDWGAEQPHMERALADLRGARHSLEVASEHKGGWRVLALRHTDEAIAETMRGIEYGKTHPRE
jgi:hypothetical protein